MEQFQDFGKIKRIFKDSMIVTEKIDGTNAQVYIFPADPEQKLFKSDELELEKQYCLGYKDGFGIAAGSRNRYITPEKDNYGFALWVQNNAEDLFKLGEGRHFGEWWGQGIQRGYGLKEKKFSLFNTSRWSGNGAVDRPSCCDVVPVLGCYSMDTTKIKEILTELQKTGSVAVPGFMDVEGVVVFHPASHSLFKYTVDDNHKGTECAVSAAT